MGEKKPPLKKVSLYVNIDTKEKEKRADEANTNLHAKEWYIQMNIFKQRTEVLQKKMREEGLEWVIIGPSPNAYYFTGLKTHSDERLLVIMVPSSGELVAVMPEMYRESAQAVIGGEFPLLTWSDQQDPLEVVKEAVKGRVSHRIAVDDTIWASHFIGLMGLFPGATFEPASRVVSFLRMFKDEDEISLMGKASELADGVMEKVQGQIRPGMSEKELALFIEVTYKQMGADDISFKSIVASGPNGALGHHKTGGRKFQEGDFIVVDCGGLVNEYCSDITRTFCLGKASEEMKTVYRAVQDANQRAFEAVVGGCSGEEADRAAREVITAAGYGSYFVHRTGHGIGMEVHEEPYLVEGNKETLLPGMVFSIEPGIYLPGKFGVRIEDIVAVTEQGPQRLNQFSRELIELK